MTNQFNFMTGRNRVLVRLNSNCEGPVWDLVRNKIRYNRKKRSEIYVWTTASLKLLALRYKTSVKLFQYELRPHQLISVKLRASYFLMVPWGITAAYATASLRTCPPNCSLKTFRWTRKWTSIWRALVTTPAAKKRSHTLTTTCSRLKTFWICSAFS